MNEITHHTNIDPYGNDLTQSATSGGPNLHRAFAHRTESAFLHPAAKAQFQEYTYTTLPRVNFKSPEPQSFLSSLINGAQDSERIAKLASSNFLNVIPQTQYQTNGVTNAEDLPEDDDDVESNQNGRLGKLNPHSLLNSTSATIELVKALAALSLDAERNATLEDNYLKFAEASFNAQVAAKEEELTIQKVDNHNMLQFADAHRKDQVLLQQLAINSHDWQHGLNVQKEVFLSVQNTELQREALYANYTLKVMEIEQKRQERIEARAVLSPEQLERLEIDEGVLPVIAGISARLKQMKFATNDPAYASCNDISLYQLFVQDTRSISRKAIYDLENGLREHMERLAELATLSRQGVIESMLTNEPVCELPFFNFVIQSLKKEGLIAKSDSLLRSILEKHTIFATIEKENITPSRCTIS